MKVYIDLDSTIVSNLLNTRPGIGNSIDLIKQLGISLEYYTASTEARANSIISSFDSSPIIKSRSHTTSIYEYCAKLLSEDDLKNPVISIDDRIDIMDSNNAKVIAVSPYVTVGQCLYGGRFVAPHIDANELFEAIKLTHTELKSSNYSPPMPHTAEFHDYIKVFTKCFPHIDIADEHVIQGTKSGVPDYSVLYGCDISES